MDKSEVYLARVDPQCAQILAEIISIPIGMLPFRYLVVPLSHKKLSISQSITLVDIISGRIRHYN